MTRNRFFRKFRGKSTTTKRHSPAPPKTIMVGDRKYTRLEMNKRQPLNYDDRTVFRKAGYKSKSYQQGDGRYAVFVSKSKRK